MKKLTKIVIVFLVILTIIFVANVPIAFLYTGQYSKIYEQKVGVIRLTWEEDNKTVYCHGVNKGDGISVTIAAVSDKVGNDVFELYLVT